METTTLKRYHTAISQRHNMSFQVHDAGNNRPIVDYIPTENKAKFISESLNIHNETGLTPRQLLEQRDELLKAAIEAVELLGPIIAVSGLRKAIQKTTKAGSHE